MPDCFKDLLLCKQFARMLCHQTQNTVFITTHVHLCSVFENTVMFQVDLQIGTAQSVCGIPHQIEPFKNRLLLRWAVILRDANNNFDFLHTIDNPPPQKKNEGYITRYRKPGVTCFSALTVHYNAVCFSRRRFWNSEGSELPSGIQTRLLREGRYSPNTWSYFKITAYIRCLICTHLLPPVLLIYHASAYQRCRRFSRYLLNSFSSTEPITLSIQRIIFSLSFGRCPSTLTQFEAPIVAK